MTDKIAPSPAPTPTPTLMNTPSPRPGLTAVSILNRLVWWLFVVAFLACLYYPGFRYNDDKYRLPLFTKWMTLALFALSVDLVWGYTGLLSLGQGLYFGIGAYLMAWYLNLQSAARDNDYGVPGVTITDYMMRCGITEVPKFLAPLANLNTTLVLILVLPGLIAGLFGLLVFRMRIKGVYFSLITQALVLAIFTLVENQQGYTGGVVGMPGLPRMTMTGNVVMRNDMRELQKLVKKSDEPRTEFEDPTDEWYKVKASKVSSEIADIFELGKFKSDLETLDQKLSQDGNELADAAGLEKQRRTIQSLYEQRQKEAERWNTYIADLRGQGQTDLDQWLMVKYYWLATTVLVVCVLGCIWLMQSKIGKVLTAIRDNETRVLALGYNTGLYKTFIFAVAGLLAGLAGALRVISERTVGPTETFGIAFSIEIVIMVAVGGRGTLFGAVIGALLVNYGRTEMNNEFKQLWPIMMGALFIVVVAFLPDGILGLLRRLWALIRRVASNPNKTLVVSPR